MRKIQITSKRVSSTDIIIKREVCQPLVPVHRPLQQTMQQPVKREITVYHQRKNMLSEYKELFSALLRLPDKEVQQKVFRCINSKYRNAETQTDPVQIMEHSDGTNIQESTEGDNINVQRETSSSSPSISQPSKTETPKKRRRKRRIGLPQVNKESRVALVQKKHKAKMSKPENMGISSEQGSRVIIKSESKRMRLDSCASDSSYLSSFINEQKRNENLIQTMIKDCILADFALENGQLPIHDIHESIVTNRVSDLKRQIFIWKKLKSIDLNDFLTDDDEDLLQLAITHSCLPEIIMILLDNGLNPSCVDDQGNTAIHLAILNDINQNSLNILLKKFDLKMLLTLNDDGYTSFQLAIRQDCYLLAECILNVMDERLSGDIFYKRDDDILEPDNIRKTNFQTYYESVCQRMETEDESEANIIKNHDLKEKLLQIIDMRSGNTALFFAIENQSEHLIYFLLAHLTDPRTENLSGQDCKTFFAEFGKTLNLSLDIDSAMEKVIKILS